MHAVTYTPCFNKKRATFIFLNNCATLIDFDNFWQAAS